MFAIGANAVMLAAGVVAVTGVPVGMTDSGTGAGGSAIEHVIIAPSLTRGGMDSDSTLAGVAVQRLGCDFLL
jgi:hypothetical protein